VGENEYTGALFFRVGSIAGTFRGKIELFNLQAPTSYDVKVQGSSSVGQVNINGKMRLEAQDNKTIMHYEGHILYGGRIASVGSRLLEMSTRTIIAQSFDTLSRYLTVKYKRASRPLNP
jgi:carbon monoxide dehydrogenase subunit G